MKKVKLNAAYVAAIILHKTVDVVLVIGERLQRINGRLISYLEAHQ